MRKINRTNLEKRTQTALLSKKTNLSSGLSSGKSKEKIRQLQTGYDLKGIKDKLISMQDYNGNLLCCYCETKKTNSPFEIEHIKPKGVIGYEELCFDWDNLLYSCRSCNGTYKGDIYEDGFLDPSNNSYFIDDHFDFDERCFYITKTEEAKINERILQINKPDKHPFILRQELKLGLIEKLELYRSKNLDNKTIEDFLKKDFKSRGEMPSFGNFILEKLISNI